MRAVMYRMEDYLLYDYAGVERHLSVMALGAGGWKLSVIFCGSIGGLSPLS